MGPDARVPSLEAVYELFTASVFIHARGALFTLYAAACRPQLTAAAEEEEGRRPP